MPPAVGGLAAGIAFDPVIFSVQERELLRDRLVGLARADARVASCALIGAEARGRADRWSDIDLGLGIADGANVGEVVSDWTREMVDEHRAVHLFDLTAMSSLYRVFLLGTSLQVDLSFTPQRDFGARGPHFRLLFGRAVDRPPVQLPSRRHLFGLGVHHAVRARFCIERDRLWQAEYWISEVRDQALTLACRRSGLDTAYGRGFDCLPAAFLSDAEKALVRSLGRGELVRALGAAVELLLRETDERDADTARLEQQLRELSEPGARVVPHGSELPRGP